MREIKFRTWDELSGMCFFSLKDMWEFETSPSKDFGEMNWMQFTGSLDKNKTEIYEGDKIKLIEEGFIYIVEWDYHGCGFFLTSVDTGGGDDSMVSVLNNDFEVIGNIYEEEK